MPVVEEISDKRIKHLEMIQSVVARMSDNSARTKNICITVFAAIVGLTAASDDGRILYVSFPSILMFCVLDMRYLIMERSYRTLYDSVRKCAVNDPVDFSLAPTWQAGESLLGALASWSVYVFYVPLLLIALAMLLIAA